MRHLATPLASLDTGLASHLSDCHAFMAADSSRSAAFGQGDSVYAGRGGWPGGPIAGIGETLVLRFTQPMT